MFSSLCLDFCHWLPSLYIFFLLALASLSCIVFHTSYWTIVLSSSLITRPLFCVVSFTSYQVPIWYFFLTSYQITVFPPLASYQVTVFSSLTSYQIIVLPSLTSYQVTVFSPLTSYQIIVLPSLTSYQVTVFPPLTSYQVIVVPSPLVTRSLSLLLSLVTRTPSFFLSLVTRLLSLAVFLSCYQVLSNMLTLSLW